ncbi:DUF262 domain-containing protein [Gluconobacter japonicus]|uniref:DUF262 domain-containing protein n=1 Tax=Gluconobacter japonicus TaxID=376620 RepID=UPI000AA11C91|nr:DUF262 domain-containing protein [Gluconobacter japonicus]
MTIVEHDQLKSRGKMSKETATLGLRLVGDVAGVFRVARYQRGYRWGKHEVDCLLDDIYESKGQPYSLQPVVVKRIDESTWELIDGQQRLTTLFLIFVFMGHERLQSGPLPYSITYETREESETFLQAPNGDAAGANIDFFHIHEAYECIRAWFGKFGARRQHEANKFYGYLFESVHLIWYEAPDHLNSTELFTRLNVGRIPLNDAELVKALLLSRSHRGAGLSDRTYEIAAQWDIIERDLQDPDIWAFVADQRSINSPTKISLILDTLAGGPRGRSRPQFYTFNVLREKIETETADSVWNEVMLLHALILGWYENRDHYHKIGYLVSTGQFFGDLVALAKGKTKSQYDEHLDDRIRETLALTPSSVASLSYETNATKCARVLFLMNVETVRRMKDSSERYAFRIHRGQAWSLEHIHAQNAESLTKVEEWRTWLHVHREALADLSNVSDERRTNLLRRIDAAVGAPDKLSFQAVARDLTLLFSGSDTSGGGGIHPLHSISNLALLASSDNSALNNAVFEVKRRRILERDRRGAYIPVCTRNVFLKYYGEPNAQQLHLWSTQDREAYMAAILSSEGGVGRYLRAEEAIA